MILICFLQLMHDIINAIPELRADVIDGLMDQLYQLLMVGNFFNASSQKRRGNLGPAKAQQVGSSDGASTSHRANPACKCATNQIGAENPGRVQFLETFPANVPTICGHGRSHLINNFLNYLISRAI
jgi:hypothetical protein